MNADPCPIETPEDRACELAALGAMNEETVRKLRLGAACDALEKCGLSAAAYLLRQEGAAVLEPVRDAVQTLRRSLRSGSDEPRYAATGAALLALGALWCCS